MSAPAVRSRFFANTALAMLALTLLSFPVTYFAPIATGAADPRPLLHVHGAFFFAWMALYAWQTHLVAAGRTARHRELGLAGLLLSGAMVPLGWAAALAGFHARHLEKAEPLYDQAAFNLVDITLFAVMIALAVAAVTRHVEWHRRFMFGAALTLLGPAMSRLFIPLPDAPPFSWVDPALLADLFFVALLVHDRRTLGRVHPATVIAILIVVGGHWGTYALKDSAWWQGNAEALATLHTTAPPPASR
jgi:hypothetical protein